MSVSNNALRQQRARRYFEFALVLSVALSARVVAQQPEIRLTVSGGTATDITGFRSRAATVSPSFALWPTAELSIFARAAGTRFEGHGWAISGDGRVESRRPIGRAALVLGAGGAATSTSQKHSFLTADVAPRGELTLGRVTLFAGGRATTARLDTPPTGLRDRFPLGSNEGGSVSRSAIVALAGASARFLTDAGESVAIGARIDDGDVADVRQRDYSLFAAVARGPLSVAASLLDRRADTAHSTAGQLSASWMIAPALSLDASAGRYPADRLTGARAGSFASVGVSLRTGGGARPLPRLPAPRGIPAPAPGTTRLSISAPRASRVDVAGDFNGWTLVSARRAENGVWYADIRIPPGSYRYAFRVDGGAWRVPDGHAAEASDFGGEVALLVVPDGTRPGR